MIYLLSNTRIIFILHFKHVLEYHLNQLKNNFGKEYGIQTDSMLDLIGWKNGGQIYFDKLFFRIKPS